MRQFPTSDISRLTSRAGGSAECHAAPVPPYTWLQWSSVLVLMIPSQIPIPWVELPFAFCTQRIKGFLWIFKWAWQQEQHLALLRMRSVSSEPGNSAGKLLKKHRCTPFSVNPHFSSEFTWFLNTSRTDRPRWQHLRAGRTAWGPLANI